MICIYGIINIVDDKCYVGQAIDEILRWREHRKQLRGYYHHSLFLQRAWCKHGEENFIFVILENLNHLKELSDVERDSILNDRETHWGNLLKPEYNVAPLGGSMRGYKHTEEARKNMSKANKTAHSDEFRQNMSKRMKGNKYAKGQKQSPEHIEARAKVIRGREVSIETRIKRSWSMTGYKPTEEARKKMSEAAKNKPPVSEATRKKLSEATIRQWNRLDEKFKNDLTWDDILPSLSGS